MPSLRLVVLVLALALGIYAMAHAPSASNFRDLDPLPEAMQRMAVANMQAQQSDTTETIIVGHDGSGLGQAAEVEHDTDDHRQ